MLLDLVKQFFFKTFSSLYRENYVVSVHTWDMFHSYTFETFFLVHLAHVWYPLKEAIGRNVRVCLLLKCTLRLCRSFSRRDLQGIGTCYQI